LRAQVKQSRTPIFPAFAGLLRRIAPRNDDLFSGYLMQNAKIEWPVVSD